MTELQDRIRTVIETEDVAVFMKGRPDLVMCGNSERALAALRAEGASFTTVDVLPDPQIRQELSALSGWPTIPQVFIKGELVGGADIVEELRASGELTQKLSAVGTTTRTTGPSASRTCWAERPNGHPRRGATNRRSRAASRRLGTDGSRDRPAARIPADRPDLDGGSAAAARAVEPPRRP